MSDDTFDPYADASAPDVSSPGELSAAPGSGLAQIRGRRAKVIEKIHIDLPVQRSEELLGVRVLVRYRAFTWAEAENLRKRFAKDKRPDSDVIQNASLLATCCQGVFTDAEADDPAAWMTFGPELAALIEDVPENEVSAKTASDVARLLYFTDGDLNATAAKVAEFSGFTLDDLEAATPGN